MPNQQKMLKALIEFLEQREHVAEPFAIEKIFPRPVEKGKHKKSRREVRDDAQWNKECIVPMRAFLNVLEQLGYVAIIPAKSRGNSLQYMLGQDTFEFLKERHSVVSGRSLVTPGSYE